MVENKKILIVDDESNFVEAFRMTMKANANEVICTSSKAEAQEKMSENPDIVVVGTIGPAGEAFSLHKWLKSHPRYKDTPLLVLDAKYEDRFEKGWRKFEGMQLEADDFLTKPIEPSLMVPRIQRLLEQVAKIIKVLVADDHTMVRDGICAVLALQKDMSVVGEAGDGREALEKVPRLLPDVALLDIMMPVMSGVQATKEIVKQYPQTRVLILTQYDEEENMQVCADAGALGFIPKKAASTQLAEGVRAVYGGTYFPMPFGQMVATK
ncbi:MAG: response regulator [Chloroflexota bacterium]|nr:response regulator [Chloroflexota bacterium]